MILPLCLYVERIIRIEHEVFSKASLELSD